MENSILSLLSVVKYILINLPFAAIVSIITYNLKSKNAIIKNAPDIFVVNGDEFNDLDDGFKQDEYAILNFSTRADKRIEKENNVGEKSVVVEFKNFDINKITKIDDMIYISVENSLMKGAELRILDSHKNLFNIPQVKYRYIARNKKLGFFVRYYDRPVKIYMIYQKKIFEYDVYNNRGSIKAKLKNQINY